MVKIDREKYMKHMVMEINGPNELVMFTQSKLGNLCLDTFFGNFNAGMSSQTQTSYQSKLLHTTQTVEPHCNIVDDRTVQFTNNPNFWTLFFDGSKMQEGAGIDCVLIDPNGNKVLFSCHLEFECTSNAIEYEALIQGLRKVVDLEVKHLLVFGDFEIVVCRVKNLIHCNLGHLKHYRDELWNLTRQFLSLNINFIPHTQNSNANMLTNVASILSPIDNTYTKFSVESLFRPLVPDNITNWRVFNDDEQII